MPADVNDLLIQQFAEFKADMKQQHAELEGKIDNLASKVNAIDHRLAHVEDQVGHVKWFWCGVGAVVAIGAKELISYGIRELLPTVAEIRKTGWLVNSTEFLKAPFGIIVTWLVRKFAHQLTHSVFPMNVVMN